MNLPVQLQIAETGANINIRWTLGQCGEGTRPPLTFMRLAGSGLIGEEDPDERRQREINQTPYNIFPITAIKLDFTSIVIPNGDFNIPDEGEIFNELKFNPAYNKAYQRLNPSINDFNRLRETIVRGTVISEGNKAELLKRSSTETDFLAALIHAAGSTLKEGELAQLKQKGYSSGFIHYFPIQADPRTLHLYSPESPPNNYFESYQNVILSLLSPA